METCERTAELTDAALRVLLGGAVAGLCERAGVDPGDGSPGAGAAVRAAAEALGRGGPDGPDRWHRWAAAATGLPAAGGGPGGWTRGTFLVVTADAVRALRRGGPHGPVSVAAAVPLPPAVRAAVTGLQVMPPAAPKAGPRRAAEVVCRHCGAARAVLVDGPAELAEARGRRCKACADRAGGRERRAG